MEVDKWTFGVEKVSEVLLVNHWLDEPIPYEGKVEVRLNGQERITLNRIYRKRG